MRGGTASVRQRYLDVLPWVIWPCRKVNDISVQAGTMPLTLNIQFFFFFFSTKFLFIKCQKWYTFKTFYLKFEQVFPPIWLTRFVKHEDRKCDHEKWVFYHDDDHIFLLHIQVPPDQLCRSHTIQYCCSYGSLQYLWGYSGATAFSLAPVTVPAEYSHRYFILQ